MELSYSLTANDLNAFAKFWSAQRAAHHKKRYTVVPVAMIAAAGFTLLVFPKGMLDIGFGQAMVAVLPPLLIFVAICLMGNHLHQKAVAKTFHGKSHVRLLDDGIHHGDEDTDARTRWEAIRRFAETGDHIFLIYGYQQAIIVPKSQVGESEQSELRDEVSRRRPELIRQP